MSYKWCIVRECKNTRIKTPQKLWIQVPNDIKMRKTWLKQARRDPKSLSTKTILYLCEDHFDLENDMENYTQYKIMGSVKRIRMKPNCVPSRFDCQVDRKHKSTPSEPRRAFLKRQRMSIINEIKETIQNEDYAVSLPSCSKDLETCSLCSKIFTSACSLREHMKIHNNKKDAFKCPLCDRGFQDERYMLRHLRTTHTRAPALPCPLCAKTLSSSAGLRHHVLTHSKLKAMRCKCCPKMAATKRSMLRHLRYRHGLSAQDVNLNDYLSGTDPRDCNLGLSEEVMTRIFGPPKKKNTDILIADFGTLAKDLNIKTDNNDDEDDDDDDEQADEEDDEQAEEDDEIDIDDDHSQGAKEGGDKGDESAQELEPTDFVTIKMESIEDNDYDFEG